MRSYVSAKSKLLLGRPGTHPVTRTEPTTILIVQECMPLRLEEVWRPYEYCGIIRSASDDKVGPDQNALQTEL